MLTKDDDMRKGTHEFFMFFKKFCKQIEDAFPKVERKRAGAAAKKPGAGNPPSH